MMNTTILESIGWALIHSLWQSALLFLLYALFSKLPVRNAVNYRYALSAVMLVLVLVTFVSTIIMISESSPIQGLTSLPIAISTSVAAMESVKVNVFQSLESIRVWVDGNLLFVIRIWLIGIAVGILRIASGAAYLYFLRRNALPVRGVWEEKMRSLAGSLNILRPVDLAEGRVSTPIVIGILKPVILFPVGLMAGLTPAQIEAILVHELAHIRRHDFAVNLFQCLMESLFFFNPFVWMLSARVRVLREECCDDTVLHRGVSPLMYVRTLAHVEELSAARVLAPSFAGQKNQLLNRMKRIMEKSIVKKEWGVVRLLPLLLALVGLVCASWLSIGSDVTANEYGQPSEVKSADSVVDGRDEEASAYFRYREDSDGEDSAWPPAKSPADQEEFSFAPMPDFEFRDSIPGMLFTPGDDWTRFEKEFTKKFSEEFGEFFNKNREQYEKMMEELRRQHDSRRAFLFDHGQLNAFEDFALINPAIPNLENIPVPEFPMILDEEWAHQMEEKAHIFSDKIQVQQDLMRLNEKMWGLQDLMLLDNANTFREYEEAIVEQLIKDGYVEKGEKVGDLHIRNDEITVNGKKIKEKDLKKYEEIRKRFEPLWARPGRVE